MRRMSKIQIIPTLKRSMLIKRRSRLGGAPQADALAEAQKDVFDQLVNPMQLATKRDLAKMEGRLTRATYNAMYGMIGAVIAVAGIAVAILK